MALAADLARTGVRRVLWITLLLNVLVSAGKIVVGTLSSSMSMVADGYHSLMDGANNVVGLVITAFADAPPDEGHPYGHRKFETAATMAIGLTLLSVAYHVVSEAALQTTVSVLRSSFFPAVHPGLTPDGAPGQRGSTFEMRDEGVSGPSQKEKPDVRTRRSGIRYP